MSRAVLFFFALWCAAVLPALSAADTDDAPQSLLPGLNRPLRAVQSSPPPHLPARPSSFSPAPSPLATAEDIERPLVKQYISRYSSPSGMRWLHSVLRQGSLYLPFVKEEISRRSLPPELLYLPVIESGYLSTARSASGAAGIWQFMLNSIGPYDMKVNELIDERRDFRKSTIGALKKLEENYRLLGSWPLALAAYNTGLGGLNRAVQKSGSRDYWLLCEKKELKTETIHYVPKLLAVAHILSQPRRYGLDYWPDAFEWAAIPVPRQISLDMLAAETGVERNLLRRLNEELLLGITPPDAGYLLKVPSRQAAEIAAVLEREDAAPLRYYRYHTVQRGETLWALANRYGVALHTLARENGMELNQILPEGKTLKVPINKETGQ